MTLLTLDLLVVAVAQSRAAMILIDALQQISGGRVGVRQLAGERLEGCGSISGSSRGVVIVEVGSNVAEAEAELRRADRLPAWPRIALLHCTRVLGRWHLAALLKGRISALVDQQAGPEEILAVIDAVDRGLMMVRLRTDLEHTSQLDRTSTSQVTMKRGLREQEEDEDLGLLARAAAGATEEDLGLALHLSSHTVHHRLERLRERLGVRNRIELAAWAGSRGLYPGTTRVEEGPAWPHTAGQRIAGSLPLAPGDGGGPPRSRLVPVGVDRGWAAVSTGTQDQPRADGTESSALRPAST